MVFKSFLKQHRDFELYWEQHEAGWLTELKASPLYDDLKLKYDNASLDKYLEYLAAHRTRVSDGTGYFTATPKGEVAIYSSCNETDRSGANHPFSYEGSVER